MADEVNNLSNIFTTSVKFYASLTRNQALGIDPLTDNNGNPLVDGLNNYIYVEPGAICFVADESGNSIILNNLLFGDGSGSGGGSGGGGSVISVNGKTGRVVINLSDFPIIRQNNVTLKTLQDYFLADGTLVTESFSVVSGGLPIITMDLTGLKVEGNLVATLTWVTSLINDVITSVYKVKGSVNNLNGLNAILNPAVGDVYNVVDTGMNYVYTSLGWDALGSTVDLSGYYSKTEVDDLLADNLTAAKNYTDGLGTSVTANTNSIADISNEINAPNTGLKARITNNTTYINNLATQLTWQ